MSLCIEKFTIEPGSSLTTRDDISGYFVEFQLLDYDYGELETPSVFTTPHSTQPVVFNFKTGTLRIYNIYIRIFGSTQLGIFISLYTVCPN